MQITQQKQTTETIIFKHILFMIGVTKLPTENELVLVRADLIDEKWKWVHLIVWVHIK